MNTVHEEFHEIVKNICHSNDGEIRTKSLRVFSEFRRSVEAYHICLDILEKSTEKIMLYYSLKVIDYQIVNHSEGAMLDIDSSFLTVQRFLQRSCNGVSECFSLACYVFAYYLVLTKMSITLDLNLFTFDILNVFFEIVPDVLNGCFILTVFDEEQINEFKSLLFGNIFTFFNSTNSYSLKLISLSSLFYIDGCVFECEGTCEIFCHIINTEHNTFFELEKKFFSSLYNNILHSNVSIDKLTLNTKSSMISSWCKLFVRSVIRQDIIEISEILCQILDLFALSSLSSEFYLCFWNCLELVKADENVCIDILVKIGSKLEDSLPKCEDFCSNLLVKIVECPFTNSSLLYGLVSRLMDVLGDEFFLSLIDHQIQHYECLDGIFSIISNVQLNKSYERIIIELIRVVSQLSAPPSNYFKFMYRISMSNDMSSFVTDNVKFFLKQCICFFDISPEWICRILLQLFQSSKKSMVEFVPQITQFCLLKFLGDDVHIHRSRYLTIISYSCLLGNDEMNSDILSILCNTISSLFCRELETNEILLYLSILDDYYSEMSSLNIRFLKLNMYPFVYRTIKKFVFFNVVEIQELVFSIFLKILGVFEYSFILGELIPLLSHAIKLCPVSQHFEIFDTILCNMKKMYRLELLENYNIQDKIIKDLEPLLPGLSLDNQSSILHHLKNLDIEDSEKNSLGCLIFICYNKFHLMNEINFKEFIDVYEPSINLQLTQLLIDICNKILISLPNSLSYISILFYAKCIRCNILDSVTNSSIRSVYSILTRFQLNSDILLIIAESICFYVFFNVYLREFDIVVSILSIISKSGIDITQSYNMFANQCDNYELASKLLEFIITDCNEIDIQDFILTKERFKIMQKERICF